MTTRAPTPLIPANAGTQMEWRQWRLDRRRVDPALVVSFDLDPGIRRDERVKV